MGRPGSFNSFWDATRRIPKTQEDKGRDFQFLLGCYLGGRRTGVKMVTAFNSFWDATVRVLQCGVVLQAFQFLLGCYGRSGREESGVCYALSIPFGMLLS